MMGSAGSSAAASDLLDVLKTIVEDPAKTQQLLAEYTKLRSAAEEALAAAEAEWKKAALEPTAAAAARQNLAERERAFEGRRKEFEKEMTRRQEELALDEVRVRRKEARLDELLEEAG